jgi:hypothetical protein
MIMELKITRLEAAVPEKGKRFPFRSKSDTDADLKEIQCRQEIGKYFIRSL